MHILSLECSYTLSTIAQSYKTHVSLTESRRRELVQDVRSMCVCSGNLYMLWELTSASCSMHTRVSWAPYRPLQAASDDAAATLLVQNGSIPALDLHGQRY